jgi:hypothetical protein
MSRSALLILNRRLEYAQRVYVDHYKTQRPHRALELQPRDTGQPTSHPTSIAIRRRDRLGGLLHEHYRTPA